MPLFANAARFRSKLAVCALFLATSPACLPAQSHQPSPASPYSVAMKLEILSPTDGVDFAPYVRDVLVSVRTKWLEKMPPDAQQGEKAKVAIGLTIQKDGAVADPGPAINRSSKNKHLDNAALDAVRASAPFDHLPAAFGGPGLKLRIYFLYNPSPGKLKPIATGG